MTDNVAFKEDRPRLSVKITREQADKLSELLPWGVKTPLFSCIVDDVISILSHKSLRGRLLIGILNKDVHLIDYAPEIKKILKEEDDGKHT